MGRNRITHFGQLPLVWYCYIAASCGSSGEKLLVVIFIQIAVSDKVIHGHRHGVNTGLEVGASPSFRYLDACFTRSRGIDLHGVIILVCRRACHAHGKCRASPRAGIVGGDETVVGSIFAVVILGMESTGTNLSSIQRGYDKYHDD